MQITSRGGKYINIDEEDYLKLKSYKWRTITNEFAHTQYIACYLKGTDIYAGLFHRIIMNVTDRKIIVDHENGNGLDDQKKNLRITTQSFNQYNRRLNKGRKNKGVYWRADRLKWNARFTKNGKLILNKFYDSEIEAIKARLEYEIKYCKGFNGFGTQQL